jgi:hypothetical protein
VACEYVDGRWQSGACWRVFLCGRLGMTAKSAAHSDAAAMINLPPSHAGAIWHAAGLEKAKFGWLKLLMLSTVAGCYVGFGFTLCLLVGGNLGQ